MDTVWHAFWAYMLFRKKPYASLAVIGSILPDFATLLLLGVHFLTQGFAWKTLEISHPVIQSLTYNYITHSMVVIVVLALLSALFWKKILPIFYGMGLHALMDYATHHGDNALPFYPLSMWKIVSPISFWETAHHSIPLMIVNTLLVCIALVYLIKTMKEKEHTRFFLALFSLGYLGMMMIFYLTNQKILETVVNGLIPTLFFIILLKKELALRCRQRSKA